MFWFNKFKFQKLKIVKNYCNSSPFAQPVLLQNIPDGVNNLGDHLVLELLHALLEPLGGPVVRLGPLALLPAGLRLGVDDQVHLLLLLGHAVQPQRDHLAVPRLLAEGVQRYLEIPLRVDRDFPVVRQIGDLDVISGRARVFQLVESDNRGSVEGDF